jgi:hypothetical protein
MPKEGVPVRAAAAIFPVMPMLTVNFDEPLLFQLLDVRACLCFAQTGLGSK